MLVVNRVWQRIVAALAALVVVLGLLATAVALAPAASAADGVSRIQVSSLSTNIDVTNPYPATVYRNFTDARNSTVPMTVTFSGTATFTVDGGAPTTLTSGVTVDVPVHTGITAIAINDGANTYNVEIKRAWLITGFAIYDGVTEELIFSRKVSDGNFDPLSRTPFNVSLPHSVGSIKWRMWYDTPTEATATQRSAWIGGGVACGTYECQSGELSEAQNLPVGSWMNQVITQVDNGTGFDYYTWTEWRVNFTRAPAYSTAALTSVTSPLSFEYVNGSPFTYRALANADTSTVPLTANFSQGTASYTVNGGSSTSMTTGVAASIPIASGLTTVQITHTAANSTQTIYTYRIVRPHPITGFEIEDYATGDILMSKTGAQFDVTNHQYYLNVPNSVSQVRIRSFYDPFPAGYQSYSWLHSYGYCDGQCESGEWSNPLTMNVGVQNGGPLMMCAIQDVCQYGDWSYWMIQITRASVAADISGVSINGTAAAGQVLTAATSGVGGYPTPTVSYVWQKSQSASGPWSDIAGVTAPRLVLTRSYVGQYVRVQATSANGVSTPTTVTSTPTSAIANRSIAAPTGVAAVPGDGSLDVSWVPPIDADYAGGTVTATGGGSTFTCTDSDFDCTLTGLTNGETYSVSVVASAGVANGAIDSPPSTPISATPAVPTAPDIAGASITGGLRGGEFLTAVATGATGTPGPTLTYVWQQSDDGVDGWSSIPGATHSALLMTSPREGKYIRVRITARTGITPAATAVSDPVGPIVAQTYQTWDNEIRVTNPGNYPSDVAFDSLGYMYVVTTYGSRDGIAKYAPGATGEDAPIAVWDLTEEGTRIYGGRIAIDSHDNVYVTDANHNRVWELPAGSRASDPLRLRLDETTLSYPTSIAVDANGYIYVGELWNHRIRVFSPGSGQSDSAVRTMTYAGSVNDLAIDPDGNLVVAAGANMLFYAPGAAGSSSPIRTMDYIPNCTYSGVAFDGDGRMWVSSDGCQKVYVFNRNAVSTVAPVLQLEGSSTYAMGSDPVTGNVSDATFWRGVVRTWDRSRLDLGPLPVEEAPALQSVTTTITGELVVRGDLTATYSGLTGLPAPSLTAQWQKADAASGPWTDIAGEIARTLAIGPSLEGKYLRMAVTVANVHGQSTTTSTPLGPVGPRPARGLVREIRGANMGVDTITDLEYLPGGRIAASNQWNSMNRISIFGPTADGNAAPAQQIEMNFNGYRSGWGLSLAPSGDLWAAYHGGWVARVHNTDDGVVEPQQLITSDVAGGLGGARSVVQDGNGYIYVGLYDQSLVKVYASNATQGSAPIRTISVPNRGLLIDVEGNLVVGSGGYLQYFEPGASTNNDPIKSVPIGGMGWDIGTDSQHRIWVLTNNLLLKVFNPLLESSSTPVLTLSDDWASKFGYVTSLAVDPESSGAFALSDGTGIKTYDWSSLLPAVPGEAAPTISNVGLTGEVRVVGDVQATVGAFSGYPDAALTYQWQKSDSASGSWSDIPGATGMRYYPVAGDAAQYLRVKVTATNRLGSASEVSESSQQLGYGYVRSPINVLRGAGTRINNPWVVRHLASGEMIVGDHQGRFQVFAGGASQNAVPLRSFYVAGLTNPSGVTQAADGSLWLAFESGPSRLVRVPVDAQGQVVPLQEISTACGRPGSGVVDAQGLLYVPCSYDNVIKVFAADASGNATPVREITGQNYVRSVAIDPSGNLAVPGSNFYRTFLMGGAGTSNTPIIDKSLNFSARDVAWDGDGNIIFSEGGGIHAYTADLADPNTQVAGFTSDGWTGTSDIYGMYFDAQRDQLRVASYNTGISTHDWAAILEGDPDIPTPATNLRTTVGIHSFTVQWDPTPGEVTNYVVTATGGVEPLTCRTTETSCTFDWFDGARGGTTYSVNVQTIRRTASATSDSVSVTPEEDPNSRPPAKITGVTATGLNGVITVSWTAPRGTVTGYTVTARLGGTTLTCEPEDATETTCEISGAQNGETYSVRVVAHRYDEDGVPSDAVSVAVERREAPTVSALTLTGTPKSGQRLDVEEPVVTGFPEPTVTYQWQSAADAEGPWQEIPDANELTRALKKPDVGRYLRLLVTASNGVGSPVRRASRVVGPILNMAGDTTTQAQPIAGLRGVFGDGRVTLSWERVKGITPDSYTITMSSGSIRRAFVVDGSEETKVVTGLINGTDYRFVVEATGHDESRSRVITVMPVGSLGKVTKVAATTRGTTLTVKWARPAGTSPVSVYRVVLDSTVKGIPDREISVKGTQAVIPRLPQGSNFRITITARNVVGFGAPYTLPTMVRIV